MDWLLAERDRPLSLIDVADKRLAWPSDPKYRGRMPELILPTTRLHAAFLECRDDWGPGLHEDGFGLWPDDDVDTPDGFAAWVHQRVRLAHPAGTPCPAEKHASPRWIVEDGQILGGIALRHIFDDDIGHIGYGIRPSARRRGLASWALGEMLKEARAALGPGPRPHPLPRGQHRLRPHDRTQRRHPRRHLRHRAPSNEALLDRLGSVTLTRRSIDVGRADGRMKGVFDFGIAGYRPQWLQGLDAVNTAHGRRLHGGSADSTQTGV